MYCGICSVMIVLMAEWSGLCNNMIGGYVIIE